MNARRFTGGGTMTLPAHLAGFGANATGRKQINAPQCRGDSRAAFHQRIDLENIGHEPRETPIKSV
jgi:hypothetical protein